jgi:hypothetical protein
MEAQNARKKKPKRKVINGGPGVYLMSAAPILLKTSCWGDERKFSERLRRLVRGDVTFARFFGLFYFRLLQRYLGCMSR